jgi:hypothetical protein
MKVLKTEEAREERQQDNCFVERASGSGGREAGGERRGNKNRVYDAATGNIYSSSAPCPVSLCIDILPRATEENRIVCMVGDSKRKMCFLCRAPYA